MALVGIKSGVRVGLGPRINSPTQLPNLAAWYDVANAPLMLKSDGSAATSGSGVALLADSSGNSGVNVLALNGVAGNYASVPSSAAFNLGDLQLIANVAPNTWTPAAQTIIARWGTAGNKSFRLVLKTTGVLEFDWSTDGTAVISASSTVSTGILAYQQKWVKCYAYHDVFGSGFDTYEFSTSANGVTWTQLGTTVVGSYPGFSPFNSTSIVETGSDTSGTANMFSGLVYRAQIYDSANARYSLDENFSNVSKLASTFTESGAFALTAAVHTTGDLGARICGARDLVQLTVANQPVYLPWSGANYLYTNSVAGNNASAPDAAPLRITSDIDLRCYFLQTSLNQVAHLINRWTVTGNQLSYVLAIDGANHLQFANSNTGTATSTNVVSTTTLPFAAGQSGWVRATFASATGFVNFYTSTDGIAWTQLGSANVAGVAATMFAGTSLVGIGYSPAIVTPLNGYIYRAQILNGIAGTVAFDFNPASYVSGTTLTDASANAATITINGGATIVTRSCLYFNGTSHYLRAAGFALSQPETVYFVGQQVTWTLGGYIDDS